LKKILKIILVTLISGGLAVSAIGCGSDSDEAATVENQVVTVQRGNLTVDITAAGNLALSYTAEPAFQIAGYVEEVLVEAGDTVEEGQVLARMDADTLEQALTTAERAVETAELTFKSSEIDLESAQNSLYELTAPYPFTTFPYFLPDSLEEVRAAQSYITLAQKELALYFEGKSTDLGYARDELITAQEKLTDAAEKMDWGLGAGITPTENYWTLRAAQIVLEKAQMTLDKYEVSQANARDDLDEARDELEKAVVRAPFAGFITTVNVEGGDEVYKGTVVAQVADPTKFEADILVSEMDIFQVKLGGEATVQVDAMSTLTLPAKVTHISPTATVSSGVVNYEVKVELESIETIMQERQEARQEVKQNITSGKLTESIKQAIEEGKITQKQAEEMMKQTQQAQEGQVPTMLPEDFQLREGLTVTVSIIVDERSDVLLVPNGAIISQGGQSYVQVVSPDEVTEERLIQTGISNWQYTEVTEGLSEGEKVVVPQGTAVTTSTTQNQRPPRGMIPGVGGHP